MMSQEPFSILAVCTGNVCRSPAAERLLGGAEPTVTVVGGHPCGLAIRSRTRGSFAGQRFEPGLFGPQAPEHMLKKPT
jgi:hypothetical protein